MLLLQPRESEKLTNFHPKRTSIEGVALILTACTCSVRRETSVRPNYVFLRLASQRRHDTYKRDRRLLLEKQFVPNVILSLLQTTPSKK